MDINKLTTGASRTASSQGQVKKAESAAPEPSSAQPAAGDAVSLTDQAQQLGRAESRMEAATGIDEAKVASIKQAISEGRYHVDPEKLAANIARFEQELSGLLDE